MSKNDDIFSKIGSAYLTYKFRDFILVGIIVFVIICIFTIPEMDKKYQQYGYTGYTDTSIKHDQWTGELIPKQELETYNNDDKYITNSKGEQITFGEMKELLDEYEEIQGNFFPIREKKIEELDEICDTLLREYLDIDYEIDNYEEDSYQFVIKGDYSGNMYSKISGACDIRGLVREVVYDKYRQQNGLEK